MASLWHRAGNSDPEAAELRFRVPQSRAGL
jgi:hypothetical protein